MADNSSLPVASGNETFANEDIAGVKYPTPKLAWGPNGTANRVDTASGKPLPVQLRGSDGTDVSLTVGATGDAAVTAGATGSLSAKLRSISRDLITRAAQVWVAGGGVGLTWTDAFTSSTLNSIASGNAIISDVAISNGTALDKYMDVSIALASAAFTGTGANIALHIYPLNADGTTYGDGKFGSSAAGPCAYPAVAVIPLVAATQAQTGTATGIVIPPGTFKLVFVNNGGVALASSGNTVKYRTYN
jgi:hypothetical protein